MSSRLPRSYPYIKPLEDVPHILHRSHYPHGFMSVSAYEVSISCINLKQYIEKPDELLDTLITSIPMAEKLRKGESRFQQRPRDFCTFNIMPGWYRPTAIAPWEQIETGIEYLTIYTSRLDTHEVVGLNRYISENMHQQKVDEAGRQVSRDLEQIVSKHVRRSVDRSIEKLAVQIPKTLQGIRDEKQQLQERLAALEAAEAKLEAQEQRRKQRSLAGYVYLLKEVNGAHYKIGRTSNPDSRVKTFGVKLPFQVAYDHLIETDDMVALEAELHQQFADCRVDGEWFNLSSEDVAYIKSL